MKDLKEFETWLIKVRKDEDEQLPFVWQIMKSPYVEYHYSLLRDKTLDEGFRRSLRYRFDEHHEDGQKLLLSKLDNNEDVDFHGEIIYMLGELNDIPLLADRLINDPDEKCRTWAATSFMQMWFRNKSEKLVEKVLPYLRQSIAQEKDYFALGCMISTVQELTKKHFGLAQKNIDNIDKEKIDNAKLKVEKFFKKLYND